MKKYAIIFLITLSGCGTSLNQKFAVGYGLNTISRNLTTTSLDAHLITYNRGVELYATQNKTRDVLDAAWLYRLTLPEKAKVDVTGVTSTLTTIINELEKAGTK
jgi:hypothetical protein